MKIFDKCEGFSTKVNFVDENNVMLGYDTDQGCCEHADWFISDKPENKIQERQGGNPDLTGWVFDKNYFQRVEDTRDFDEGGMVIFCIKKGRKKKFIHLFNCHNGYYGHGFAFKEGNEVIQEAIL